MSVKRSLIFKLTLTRILVTGAFIWLMGSLFQTSILQAQSFGNNIDNDGWVCYPESPIRGSILDRTGRALAKSSISRDIMAVRGRMDPGIIPYIAEFISPEIGVSKAEISDTLSNGGFEVSLKTGLSEDKYDSFCAFRKSEWRNKLDDFYIAHPELKRKYNDYNDFFLDFRKSFKEIVPKKNKPRCYPLGQILAHLVGYSSEVQNTFTAWKGVEYEFNKVLRGVGGDVRVRYDAFKRPIPGYEPFQRGIIPGWNLRLTIASDIQAMVFNTLEERIKATESAGGTIIVLDAKSSEILAMASYPSFDPANYNEALNEGPSRPDLLPIDQYRLNPMHNLATQLKFEPGSVMKPIVAAWGLREGKIKPDDLYEVKPAGYSVPGKKKPIRDTHPPDKPEMWDIKQVLVESSNQGMAQVGIKIGRDSLIEGLSAFGLGRKVLDFSEESAGDIRDKQKWWPVVQEATTAFGQGVSMTPLQLAATYNVFANGGYYVKPKIVLDATSLDGDVKCYSSDERVQVLPLHVLDVMLDAMEGVVVKGTGKPAACKGYRVAGKTGTAQKPDHINRGYFDNRHYASFCGFGPLPDPKYTILVLLDEPKTKWGGGSCGPAFKKIFEYLMIRDGIPPIDQIASVETGTDIHD